MSTGAPALLFLPGASGNTALWKPVGDRLRRPGDRRYLGWPGLGGIPPEPDVQCLDDLVARVLRETEGPLDVLAQSMGGVVAVRAALAAPLRVRHLVLSVTSGGIDMRAFGAIDWRPQFRLENPRQPTWFADDRVDLSGRLREIDVPVLLLFGDADPLSPVAVGQKLAELFPHAELVVVEGGTHDLVLEHANSVVGHIERHLAS